MRIKRTLRIGLSVTLLTVLLAGIWSFASFGRLAIPPISGPHAVGRLRFSWSDAARREHFVPQALREIVAEVWYPAKPGSGQRGAYFPELATIAEPLVETGELSYVEAWALTSVAAQERTNAEFANLDSSSPVIIFSPGNATNVELYSAICEDLASRGYIVFGINHPYDVGAVRLGDGTIAKYQPRTFGDNEALTMRMRERAADLRFVLDELPKVNAGTSVLAGRLDLSRVALAGHSLGGLAAAEVCASDSRPRACINVDGLQFGNPYGANKDAIAPPQPFLYLGKERTIGTRTRQLLEENHRAEIRSIANATHQSFQDGGLFVPTINPWDGRARDIVEESRQTLADFLKRHIGSNRP